MPGGVGRVGGLQQQVGGLQMPPVVPVAPPVPVGDPPGGGRVAGQLLQPFFLLPLADVQEELQDQIAVVSQLPLEDVHRLQQRPGPAVLRLHLLQHPAIPASIQHGRLPPGGQIPPEGPQQRPPRLLVGGLRRRIDLIAPGVHLGDDLGDHAPLARGAPALKDQEHRHPRRPQGLLQGGQLLLQGLDRLFFRFPGQRRRPFLFLFQHGTFLLFRDFVPPPAPAEIRGDGQRTGAAVGPYPALFRSILFLPLCAGPGFLLYCKQQNV